METQDNSFGSFLARLAAFQVQLMEDICILPAAIDFKALVEVRQLKADFLELPDGRLAGYGVVSVSGAVLW